MFILARFYVIESVLFAGRVASVTPVLVTRLVSVYSVSGFSSGKGELLLYGCTRRR